MASALLASAAIGAGAAGADELANLKANQEVLQQRLDELALGAPLPVAPEAPTLAGRFPRSFLIPGTDTSISIAGYVNLDVTDWLTGGPVNGNALTSFVGANNPGAPLDLHGTGLYAPPFFNPHSRGSGVLQFSARESRLRVETRTPTVWGEAQTVFELDFEGCTFGLTCQNLNQTTNSDVPRLRLAYGTLGPFLAGQTWVPVFDLQAHPETVDFGLFQGEFGYLRAPQIAYTGNLPFLSGATYEIALVYPATTLQTAAGPTSTDAFPGVLGATTALPVDPAKSTWPDGNFVLGFEQPWGHVRLNGVVQDLELQDGHFLSKEYIGYGAGFSGNVKPGWFGWAKDNIGFEAYAGDGLDRYATDDSSNLAGAAAGLATNFGGPGLYGSSACAPATPALCSAAAAGLIRAKTITAWGGQASYQHFWRPDLRSTAVVGIVHWDTPTQLVGLSAATFTYNKEIVETHLNLLWSPVAFINTGIEYLYGHRVTVWNQKGDAHALEGEFQVKF